MPRVLSNGVLKQLNDAIDANADKIGIRSDRLDGRHHPTSGGSPAAGFTGTHGRGDFGGFLWDWGEPAGAAFRSLIANEHAMRIMIGVIGDAFRLAGLSGITQTAGAEGFVLHVRTPVYDRAPSTETSPVSSMPTALDSTCVLTDRCVA